MTSNPYQPPKSKLESEVLKNNKPTEFIITMAVILTLLSALINYRTAGVGYVQTPEKIGAAISNIAVSVFFVLPFQLFRRFRNSKSRLKIYNWFMLVFLILSILTVTR
jgi:FlaA1/EpsC-like NDP-sugar epimerase